MKKIEEVLRENGILTLEEGARLYKVSESNLRNLVTGKIKTYILEDHEKAHIGGMWFIREQALERYYQKIEGKVAYEKELSGEELKELRKKKGYTHSNIARELRIPEWQIVSYESGKEEIPKELIDRLIKILK
jgi:DNA-binding transcriptional regulator YiaG